jgi:hypothetical protein
MRLTGPFGAMLKAIVPIGGVLLIVLVLVPMALGAVPHRWLPWMFGLIVLLFCANYFLTRWWVRFVGRRRAEDKGGPSAPS